MSYSLNKTIKLIVITMLLLVPLVAAQVGFTPTGVGLVSQSNLNNINTDTFNLQCTFHNSFARNVNGQPHEIVANLSCLNAYPLQGSSSYLFYREPFEVLYFVDDFVDCQSRTNATWCVNNEFIPKILDVTYTTIWNRRNYLASMQTNNDDLTMTLAISNTTLNDI